MVDYRCSSGPAQAPYTELHDDHSVAYVRRGSFGCQVRGESFELVAGAIFVVHPGDECPLPAPILARSA